MNVGRNLCASYLVATAFFLSFTKNIHYTTTKSQNELESIDESPLKLAKNKMLPFSWDKAVFIRIMNIQFLT